MQTQQIEKREYLTTSEMWEACSKNWLWFVLSAIIGLSLAFFFMKRTKPLYHRTASLMILSSSKNEEFKYSDLKKIKGLGLGVHRTKLPNEIALLKSPFLMDQVVEKLHLNVEFKKQLPYYDQLVYGSEVPVNVVFADRSLSGAHFKLSLLKNKNLVLTEFSNREENPVKVLGHVGDTLKTPLGKVIVSEKPNFDQVCDSLSEYLVYHNITADLTKYFLETLEVENQTKWTDVISLSLVDQSLERADDVLNTLMQVYDENSMRVHSQKEAKTVEFLTERVKQLSSRLGNIDNNIASYKGAHLISSVQSTQGIYMKDRYDYAGIINNQSAQLAALQYVKDNMNQEFGSNNFIPSDIGIDNFTIRKQINNYNALQQQRNDYAAAAGEGNPRVLDLDRQLSIYRKTILSTIDQQTAVMQTKLDGLEQQASTINSKLSSSAHEEMHLASTSRMHTVLAQLYAFLYIQKERSAIALSHNVSTITVLQQGHGSSAPIAPLKKQIMLMGLVVGLAIPFVTVFFRTISDDKVYQRSDLKGLKMPILGEIPNMVKKISWFKKKTGTKKLSIFVENNTRDSFNESMRLLRTNIEFMKSNGNDKLVVMMTSAEANCGKSFIASNLAASIALLKKKVVLVDLDMRKATASTLVKDAKKGLSSYLSYHTDDLNELVCKNTYYKGVDVLPVGSLPPNPTELLHGERLNDLMIWLKENYDFIIIDCPPVDIVADDDLINVYADVTLFVLRAGQTDIDMLIDVNNLYDEKRFKNMCGVLNDVVEAKDKNNSYYGSTNN